MRLSLGVEQPDRRPGLGGEQSIEHAAVRGRGGVLHEVSLDVPARIEDVYQKLLAGMRGHAGKVRPDLAAGAEWAWHLAHCCSKTSFPLAGSPPLSTAGVSSSITFCRFGSGRPPPLARSFLARSAIVVSG